MVHFYVHYYATVVLIPSVSSRGSFGNKTWIHKKAVQKYSATVNIRYQDNAMQTKEEILF